MKKKKKTIHVIKVVIVVLMALGVAFSALAPIFAEDRGNLKEEIKEEINIVREELSEIEEDISTLPTHRTRTVAVKGIPSGFTFGNNLRERATGEGVRHLQKVLNTDPDTRVAWSGGGSPGNETSYFGPKTRSAVIKFQQKHGIPATGDFLSQTRAKANEIIQGGVVITESVEMEDEEIKERIRGALRMIQDLRKKAALLYEEEDGEDDEDEEDVEKKTLSTCLRDVVSARAYSKEQEICTMEFKEMSCNGAFEYGAKDGCEISFLKGEGWSGIE